MSSRPQIVVVDANAPWVRSLFRAMRDRVDLFFLRVYNVHPWRSFTDEPLTSAFAWQRGDDGIYEQHVPVAGWARFPRISTAIVASRCRSRTRRFGAPLATVYTFPNYANVVPKTGPGLNVYFAHDPFTYYVNNSHRIAALEAEILRTCDATFAVSQAIVEDFAPAASGPVFYSPNAVDQSTIDAHSAPIAGRPADLPADGKIVGCVGQINDTFEWELIDSITRMIPDATFVFIGPVIETDPAKRRAIEAVFQRPNVKWLGPKAHAQLTRYVRHFDVCLSPLRVSPWNDRRSPLRFYDYLASGKPIVTTAVREASVHQGLLMIAHNADQCVQLINAVFTGAAKMDQEMCSRYIRANTWADRAGQFLDRLQSLQGKVR